MKKDLPKALKSIRGEDRVLVVGTTRDPVSADIKLLCKVYNKIILIPRPDYSARYGTKTHQRPPLTWATTLCRHVAQEVERVGY